MGEKGRALAKVVVGVLATIGLLTLALLFAIWLFAFVFSGKVVQREVVSIALAGKAPLNVVVVPCGGRAGSGKVVGDTVRASFWICEGTSYVILPFEDFDAVCTIPYTSGSFANDAPFRFRLADRKCEAIG